MNNFQHITPTASKKIRFTTFNERNNLLRLLDKVPYKDQVIIMAHVEGWLSVQDGSEIFFIALEKYYKEWQERQPSLFQSLPKDKNEPFVQSVMEKLDSIGE